MRLLCQRCHRYGIVLDADGEELDCELCGPTPWVLSAEEGAGGLHPDLEAEVFGARGNRAEGDEEDCDDEELERWRAERGTLPETGGDIPF